jgi:hypothetical protein
MTNKDRSNFFFLQFGRRLLPLLCFSKTLNESNTDFQTVYNIQHEIQTWM